MARPPAASHGLTRWLPAAVALLIGIGYLLTQPALFDTGVINNDNRNMLAPFMHLDREYAHLAGDPLLQSAMPSCPPGYRVFMRAFVPLTGILAAAQLFHLACLALYLVFAYRIGTHVLGRWGGIISVCFAVTGTYVMRVMAGGNPRAAGPVLYMALLCFLVRGDLRGLGLVAVAGALFHPQPALAALIILGLLSLTKMRRAERGRFLEQHRRDLVFLACAVVVTVSVGVGYSLTIRRASGGVYSLQEAREQPTWRPKGRIGTHVRVPFKSIFEEVTGMVRQFKRASVYPLPSSRVDPDPSHPEARVSEEDLPAGHVGRAVTRFARGWTRLSAWNSTRYGLPGTALCYILLPALLAFRGFFRIPRAVRLFCLAIPIAHAAACFAAFRLYLPTRFVQCPVAVLLSQFLIIGIGSSRLPGTGIAGRRTRVALAAALLLAESCFYGTGIAKNNALETRVREEEAGLHAYILSSTPEKAMFAGKPRDMDDIPLFSRRGVLISHEIGLPWFRKTNEEILIPRATAVARAYFSGSAGPFRRLRNKFGVDYFLVDKRDYASEAYPASFIHAPFSRIAHREFERNRGDFLLGGAHVKGTVYEDERYRLVDLHRLLRKDDGR